MSTPEQQPADSRAQQQPKQPTPPPGTPSTPSSSVAARQFGSAVHAMQTAMQALGSAPRQAAGAASGGEGASTPTFSSAGRASAAVREAAAAATGAPAAAATPKAAGGKLATGAQSDAGAEGLAATDSAAAVTTAPATPAAVPGVAASPPGGDLVTKFYVQVASIHEVLTEQGMEPNESAALALRVAAGMARMPTFVKDVRAQLSEARQLLHRAKELHIRRFLHSDSEGSASSTADAAPAVATGQPSASRSNLNAGLSSSAAPLRPDFAAPQQQQQQLQQPPSSEQLQEAEHAAQKALGHAAHLVFLLFSSLDSMHSAFWLPKPPAERGTGTAPALEAAAAGRSGGGAGDGRAGTEHIGAGSGASVGETGASGGGSSGGGTASLGQGAAVGGVGMLGGSAGVAGPRALEEEQVQLQRLDLAAVRSLYAELLSGGEVLVTMALKRGIEQLLETIGMTSHTANPGLMRQLAIVLACPLMEDMDHASLLESLSSLLVGLSSWMQQKLVALLSTYNRQELQRLVVMLQQYITLTLYQQQAITRGVEDATQALGLVHRANEICHLLPLSEFYNDAVNNEDFNIKEDFRRWKAPFQRDFSFCTCPFVYDPSSKARVLQLENQMAQFNELQGALFRGMLAGSDPLDMCPFLVLKVRRGAHLVQDTLIQIHRAKEQDALRKPLKVKFMGEEGVDEGGVQKEFFQLLVRELFNPDYGMFTYDETTRLNWFRPSDLDMDLEFELVGILIGLAIYNSHILEFQFPQVLYKRLMGLPVCLSDLVELHPEVHASLTQLLSYEGDFEDLALSFQVNMEVGFGDMATVDLVPGGGDIPVTASNRNEYVAAYTTHLLEASIDRQFTHFRAGFLRMCSGTALSWFRPQELELLVCGGRELNLEALEGATLYDDGYNPNSQVVRWFWEVSHSLGEARKKQLLFFVTGSDRVPIKGLAHLNPPFVISRMGGDGDRLPTAHTCFNHLLLPQYSSKEVLRQRLECALDNSEGFGLM